MRLSATRLTSIASITRKAWTPRLLFAPGDLGAWYDPSDLLTLFQDSAGTTPVTTTGNPIGLGLDKRRQSSYITSTGDVWTKTGGDGVVTITGNVITVTGATTLTSITRTAGSIPLATGYARLRLRVDYSAATGVIVWLRGVPAFPSAGVDIARVEFLNNGTLDRLDVGTGSATFTIQDLAYWEGNHARRATTTARPAYRTAPSRVDYDGIDDVLVTTFASSLGANCTIVRAVPNVGAVILTGQTIGTMYSDNQDHCGLLIINRALTAAEIAKLTIYFDAKAQANPANQQLMTDANGDFMVDALGNNMGYK